MNTFQIIVALLGLSFIAVLIEKGMFAFWRWIRRDAKMKELSEKVVELQKQNEVQRQELSEYNNRKRVQDDLEIYRQLVYRSKTTEETYCITCWDGNGKLVHVIPQYEGYYCGVCKKRTEPLTSNGPSIQMVSGSLL